MINKRLTYINLRSKNGAIMARPTKLTPEIQQKIGDGISLGLTYALAANSAGITYQTLNQWISKGKTDKSGKYFEFCLYIQKCNADAAKILLEHLKSAADAGNCTVCMWILERRFSEDFGRRQYRKIDVVSENKNVNIEINVNDADGIRAQILERFNRV
jgi:hypothetical protein